jgi:4-carboxymuconolactone decarboxylase
MPHIPAICDRCQKAVWSKVYIKDDTYHLNDTVEGNCECGGTFRVLDGTYTHLGGPLGYCRAPKEDRERFYKAMQELEGDAWVRPEDRDIACPMPTKTIKGVSAKGGSGNGHGKLGQALSSWRRSCVEQGPLDQRSAALVQLGAVLAGGSQDDVAYQVGLALEAGISPAEVEHTALCALPAIGEPRAMKALGTVSRALEELL